MAYTPKSWVLSDLVTHADMNHTETQFDEAYDYYLAHSHTDRYYYKAAARTAFWHTGNDGPGSGADADMLYHASGNKHASEFAGLGIPAGLIIMWETTEIPSGWHLCNGEAGTRDLRDRMIIGAGTGSWYSVGATGGSSTFTAAGSITVSGHSLTVAEMPSHRHPFQDKYTPTWTSEFGSPGTTSLSYATGSGTTPSAGSGSAHGHSATEGTAMTGNAVACMPYSRTLLFIQKL